MTKSVILSFDDGPAPVEALRSILDTLTANSIVAEFYLIGQEVDKFRDAAKLIVSKGHKVQNHTWNHPDLRHAPLEKVRSELKSTQDIISKVTGVTPTKVRPPYGAGGWPKHLDPQLKKVANELHLQVHNWDVDTEDWKQPRGLVSKMESIKKQVTSKKKSGIDMLMHVQTETARDLPLLIKDIKAWGYGFDKPT